MVALQIMKCWVDPIWKFSLPICRWKCTNDMVFFPLSRKNRTSISTESGKNVAFLCSPPPSFPVDAFYLFCFVLVQCSGSKSFSAWKLSVLVLIWVANKQTAPTTQIQHKRSFLKEFLKDFLNIVKEFWETAALQSKLVVWWVSTGDGHELEKLQFVRINNSSILTTHK